MNFYLLTFFLASFAQAFPAFIETNTLHCLKCHTSSDGRGLLNKDGKLAAETFSQNSNKYLQIDTPEWLTLGASTQLLQTFIESTQTSSAKSSLEQVQASVLIDVNSTQLFLTAGRYEPQEIDITFKDYAYLPEFYLQTSYFKIGRYKLNYGIADHDLGYIRNVLTSNFQGHERNQLEVHYAGSNFQISFAKIWNQFNFNRVNPEDGSLINLSYLKNEKNQIGINFYRSQQTSLDGVKSNLAFEGIYLVNLISTDLSVLTQVDQFHYSSNKKGVSFFIKPQYLYQKGLLVFSTLEYANQNIEISDPKFQSIGIGVDYYPMTHVWLSLTYKNQRNTMTTDADTQAVLASLNLYM